ncbi:MAG: DUF3859 domain-containing protein [Pseudomonadota bacterium]
MVSSVISNVEVGIVCPPEPIGSTPAPGTIAGATHIIVEEPQFVSVGSVVPAAIGVGFGVKSQAVDPAGLGAITMVLTHPPMGDAQITLQQFQTSISGQDPSLTFYQFDYPYELVEGTWMFTAMQGEQALFSVSFEVVDPLGMPSLAEMCGYSNLFS